jgi:hypothetical protein
MNVNPGGKQTLMCDTIIPLTNPEPEIGEIDTCGLPQTMVFPHDHPDPNLAGNAKGMAAVVKERKSVYKRLVDELRGKKVVRKCGQCRKSAAKKDAERCVALAEMAGQEELLDDAVLEAASKVVDEPQGNWCCLY